MRPNVGERVMSPLDSLVDRHRGLQRDTRELRCALGEYASDRTFTARLRRCGFTQSSITEVFAGSEHQGEYLDKTIAELREKPSLRLVCDSITL